MASLYADEDFDYGVVERLRTMGHDVVTVQEAGRAGMPDSQVLADATADGRAVLTFNRDDFKKLHRLNLSHAGMVSCSRDTNLGALTVRIHNSVIAAGSLSGQHLRVNL